MECSLRRHGVCGCRTHPYSRYLVIVTKTGKAGEFPWIVHFQSRRVPEASVWVRFENPKLGYGVQIRQRNKTKHQPPSKQPKVNPITARRPDRMDPCATHPQTAHNCPHSHISAVGFRVCCGAIVNSLVSIGHPSKLHDI
jgi:hypothetical protein